ncbi:MAG: peptide deformylase [Gammaproteobacteria bacterium]|nr:peptide deformylase [Gammaproteobacteria bacterium]|tara:strand:+ start:949 stop:1485 length:537 start_codon:yes stop_codon:yes gene_type:complete
MAKLKILHFPDNRLRQKCPKVEAFDSNLKQIVDDMFETMYEENGIGLAAIQVNIIQRIIVIDISKERNEPLILINPEIINKQNKIEFEEGCLSVPGFYEKVERYNNITFKAQLTNGDTYNRDVEGLLSVCVQHEIDHLDGKLFVDYISSLKRERIAKKIQKLQAEGKKFERKNIPYSI